MITNLLATEHQMQYAKLTLAEYSAGTYPEL